MSHPAKKTRRIIPACAGNTSHARCAPNCQSDHPRVRGEHSSNGSGGVTGHGSSPRARGTLGKRRILDHLKRIIPACAGNTGAGARRPRRRTDHPRVRGEHRLAGVAGSLDNGSSPRARGTPMLGKRQVPRIRIIPACAGNTQHVLVAHRLPADHPRVRGEHTASSTASAVALGSSPRARGTPRGIPPPGSHRRIIPACAGNT